MPQPSNPTTARPSIYPRQMKTHLYTRTHTQIFIVVYSQQPTTGNSSAALQRAILSSPTWTTERGKGPSIKTHNNLAISPELLSHILHDAVYITFLKRLRHRCGEQTSGCQGLGGEGKRRAGGVNTKEWLEGALGWQNSASWLCPCQRPGCDTALKLCEMLPLGKLDKGYISFHIISYNCV